MNCLHCGKETSNEKYCSRKCATTRNNKIPKRKITLRICRKCGVLNDRKTSVTCSTCVGKRITKQNEIGFMTLDEVATRYTLKGVSPSYKHAFVRNHCHALHGKRERQCQLCGYATHVELCHVKAIASFPTTATLNEVNADNNIVVLCRNHHWELDNGYLRREDIP